MSPVREQDSCRVFPQVSLDVHDQIFPAMCEQVFGHVVGLCFDLGFGHRRAERIPAVPAHRRRSRPFPEGRGGFGMGIGICGKNSTG